MVFFNDKISFIFIWFSTWQILIGYEADDNDVPVNYKQIFFYHYGKWIDHLAQTLIVLYLFFMLVTDVLSEASIKYDFTAWHRTTGCNVLIEMCLYLF